MLTTTQSVPVVLNLGVDLRNSAQARKHARERTQGRLHQKSKTGYQWPHKKEMMCPQIFFYKKK